MISHKKINTLFVSIVFIEIVTIILGFAIGSSFYFCLRPFIYIGLALFVYLFIPNKYIVKREKKYVNQITIMSIIAYMLIYILSGIVFGFAYNPLVMKKNFFVLNLVYYIPTVVSVELVRYRVINYIDKDKQFPYVILLSIILAFAMSNFSITNFQSIKSFVEMFYQVLVPNFVIGCFLSYIDIRGSLYISIVYVLVPVIYQLFVRIIPNPEWIILVLIKTFIPIIAYTILEKIRAVKVIEPRNLEKKKGKTFISIFGVTVMVVLILFACGIFRIYPVAIASNSMNPAFSRGDIQIIDKKEQIYRVGDVIQFYGLNNTIFVHRVVSVRTEEGTTYYTTKGDNNDTVDLMEISQSRVIGKAIMTVKYLGYPTIFIAENF